MTDGTPIIIKKKKGHGGHAHHGGSWKVAYADFVTAMMAFFMVMWIMGLSQDTRAQIQGYFNDPLGFVKNEPKSKVNIAPQGNPNAGQGTTRRNGEDPAARENEAMRSVGREIKSSIESAPDLKEFKEYVSITETEDGLVIEFVESKWKTFFESGSAVIRPEAAKLFGRLAPILAKAGRKMIVEGHTDAQPYPGTVYTNWDLSNDRANALRRALQAGGVADRQIMEVRGWADRHLRDAEHPLDPSNRRVSLLLQKDDPVAGLPKEVLEGTTHVEPPIVDLAPPIPKQAR